MKGLFNLLLIATVLLSCSCQKAENFDNLPPDSHNTNVGPVTVPNQNIKVYVGGGDNAAGAFLGYLDAKDDWRYVQQYADDY
jgi:hypothetical protein